MTTQITLTSQPIVKHPEQRDEHDIPPISRLLTL